MFLATYTFRRKKVSKRVATFSSISSFILMNYEFIILACFFRRRIIDFQKHRDLFSPLGASNCMEPKQMKANNELENEADLVRRSQDGSVEAFSLISEHYLPIVHRRIWFSIPTEDADDVTQEVFITLVRKISTFRGTAKFSTWLYTITNRKIADYYRRNSKKEMNYAISLDEEGVHKVNLGTDDSETLDKMIMLRKGFSQIPKQYKEVLILRMVDGLSFQEVAVDLGISYEATKSLFRRAMSSLQKAIGEH